MRGSSDLRFIPAKTRAARAGIDSVPCVLSPSRSCPTSRRHDPQEGRSAAPIQARGPLDGLRRERNRRPYDNVLETIGWTPLIRLNAVTRGIRTPVYGKAEFFNPGGSVKDRIAMPIIERAEREGTAQARWDDRRRNKRKYWNSAGHRSSAPRLQVHIHDARQDVAGKGATAQGVRCRGDHHPDGSAARPSRQLRDDGEANREGNSERDSGRSVLQRGESRRRTTRSPAPSLGADRRTDHAFRRRGRNRRHDHWRRTLSQGEESEDPHNCGRSRRVRFSPITGGPMGRKIAKEFRTRSKESGRTRFPGRST